jgi:hypothetical protein
MKRIDGVKTVHVVFKDVKKPAYRMEVGGRVFDFTLHPVK